MTYERLMIQHDLDLKPFQLGICSLDRKLHGEPEITNETRDQDC